MTELAMITGEGERKGEKTRRSWNMEYEIDR